MKIPIIDYAKPYIVVSSKRMRKAAHERALANLKKRKPKKPPNAKDASFDADDATPEPQEADQREVGEDSASAVGAPLDTETTTEEDAFVVSKVEYFSTTNGLRVLMWSVLGCVGYIFFILQMG